jgi:hypothetical protein
LQCNANFLAFLHQIHTFATWSFLCVLASNQKRKKHIFGVFFFVWRVYSEKSSGRESSIPHLCCRAFKGRDVPAVRGLEHGIFRVEVRASCHQATPEARRKRKKRQYCKNFNVFVQIVMLLVDSTLIWAEHKSIENFQLSSSLGMRQNFCKMVMQKQKCEFGMQLQECRK